MATYDVTLRNPENTVVESRHTLSFDDTAPTQPVKVNAVSPVGTINSGALPTQQLVTATGAQISTTRDVDTYTLLTSDATNNIATCTVALSPDNVTYSTICVPSLAAALNNLGALAIPLSVRVPAGWYIKLTSTRFTIGVTTYAQQRVTHAPASSHSLGLHAATHKTDGTDPLAAADVGAATAAHVHAQSDVTGLAAAVAAKPTGGQAAIADLNLGVLTLLPDVITAVGTMQGKVNTLLAELRTAGLLLP